MKLSEGNQSNLLDVLVQDVISQGPKIAIYGGGLASRVDAYVRQKIPNAIVARFDSSRTLYLWPEGLVLVFRDSWGGDNLFALHAADIIEARIDEQGWDEVSESISEGTISSASGSSFLGALVGGSLIGRGGMVAGSIIASSGARETYEETRSQATGTIRRDVVTISTSVWDYPLIKLQFGSNDEAMEFHARLQTVIRVGQSQAQINRMQPSGIVFNSKDVEQEIKDVFTKSQMYMGIIGPTGHQIEEEISREYSGPDEEPEKLFQIGSALLFDIGNPDKYKEKAKQYLVRSANLGHQEAAEYLATIILWDDEADSEHWLCTYFESLSEVDRYDPKHIYNGLNYLWRCDESGQIPVCRSILEDLANSFRKWPPSLRDKYLEEGEDFVDYAAEYVSSCLSEKKVPKEKDIIEQIFSFFEKLSPGKKSRYVWLDEYEKLRQYLASCDK